MVSFIIFWSKQYYVYEFSLNGFDFETYVKFFLNNMLDFTLVGLVSFLSSLKMVLLIC